jgi:hypothetical protein
MCKVFHLSCCSHSSSFRAYLPRKKIGLSENKYCQILFTAVSVWNAVFYIATSIQDIKIKNLVIKKYTQPSPGSCNGYAVPLNESSFLVIFQSPYHHIQNL